MVGMRLLDLGGARVPATFFERVCVPVEFTVVLAALQELTILHTDTQLADRKGIYNTCRQQWEKRGSKDRLLVTQSDIRDLCDKLQVRGRSQDLHICI